MTAARIESWAWRLLMPALLWGGVAASWIILIALVSRALAWRQGNFGASRTPAPGVQYWVLYFGLNLLAGWWSANLDAWAFSLEVKSSLWVLPLIALIPGQRIDRDFWWSVGWGVTAYLLWRLLRAGWHHLVLADAGQWRYATFSGDVHPTYLSLHAAVAWLGLGREWGKDRAWAWGVTGLLALSLGLMGSKAGILAAALVGMAGLVVGRQWPGGRPMAVWQTVAFLAVLAVASWGASGARFQEMESAAAAVQSEKAPVTSSSAGRVAVWRASAELIADHPFGVGTGDVTDALMEVYARDGIDYARDRRLNPHNQWLQAGVAFGWPGMLVLSLALLSWGWAAWRIRNRWALLGVGLVMAHAMVESVLETQRGVVFILWMYVAFLHAMRPAPPR